MSIFEREALLVGEDGVRKLSEKTVAVFGLGGVGSFVCEALARGGIGHLILVDNDTVAESNLNRQLVALHSTLGKKKTEVAKARVFDINPAAKVETYEMFYMPDTADEIDLSVCDFVVDAIDTVTAKLELAVRCDRLGVPCISCMGTGNRLDATKFCVTDINKTDTCRLARVMRRELRKRGVKKLKVVYSKAEPKPPTPADPSKRKQTPGSISFVPPVAGMICAGEVIRTLLELE